MKLTKKEEKAIQTIFKVGDIGDDHSPAVSCFEYPLSIRSLGCAHTQSRSSPISPTLKIV